MSERFGDRFQTGEAIRAQHAHTTTYIPAQLPDGVVFPESAAEVEAIVAIASEHGVPLIAFGTGSSLEGHINAPHGGMSVDMSRMDKVLEVNASDFDCTVQPGITREALNIHLRDTGLFFPIDPGANASIGGMASTRASGTNAVRYGTMKDNVLALTAVTAGGKEIRTAHRARKSSAGYDLTRLFVGAEGTLGILTSITLRLQGIPEMIAGGVCSFPSVSDACNTVILTIQSGIPVARIELLDAVQMRASNAYSGVVLPGNADAVRRVSRQCRERGAAIEAIRRDRRRIRQFRIPLDGQYRGAQRSCGRRGTMPIGRRRAWRPGWLYSPPMSACRSRGSPIASRRRMRIFSPMA